MTNIPIKNFANKLHIAQKRMWIDEKLCLSGLDIAIFPDYHVLAFKNIHIHPSDQGGGRRRGCFYYRLETYLANAQVTFFDRWIFGQVATHIFK